jgi:hypothetical protein
MARFVIPEIGPVDQKTFENYWKQKFANDPQMQEIFARVSRMGGGEKEKEREATLRAQELGWQPPDHDWSVDFDKGGFRTERAGFLNRNKDWLIPAAIGGVTLGMGAMGSGPLAGILGGGGGTTGATSGMAAAQALEGGATLGLTPEIAAGIGTGANAASAASGIGGWVGKAGSILDKAEPILGNMAKSGAEANRSRDVLMPSAENSKLARDKFALEAPGARMGQSLKASILAHGRPTSVEWGGPGSGLRGEIPHFSGGVSGAWADLDPRARQLGDSILTSNLQNQLAGKDAETPYLDKIGSTSTMDKIIGGVSTGTSILRGLGGLKGLEKILRF